MELKDERVFECSSKPHRIGEAHLRPGMEHFATSASRNGCSGKWSKPTGSCSRFRGKPACRRSTGVLHNVGNVLNSVNVSTVLVIKGLDKSKIPDVTRLSELLAQNAGDLASFLTHGCPRTPDPGLQ